MMFIVFNVFLAIICEAIDGDYEEEFVKQAGDIQVMEYMTRQLKDILGIARDDHMIEADGEDLPEHKVNVMNQKMMELECIVDKLVLCVDTLDDCVSAPEDSSPGDCKDTQKTMITEVIVDNDNSVRPMSALSNVSEIRLQ